MSMLSAKNFVVPLLETRNIIAIILIAVFFGVLRFSGGGISTSATPQSIKYKQQPTQVDSKKAKLADSGSSKSDLNKKKSTVRKRVTRERESLDDLLYAKPKKQEPVKRKQTPNRLEDIERSLGIK